MKNPRNGYELMQARKQGMKPRGVVLVTDCKEPLADCQLIITPGFDYNFAMVRGLDVFMALETDFLKWEFKPYRKWFLATEREILKVAKSLYVFPWEEYAPNS